MDLNDLTTFIQNVGFPIVCCLALFKQNADQNKLFNETIDKLRLVIDDNNRILEELQIAIERSKQNGRKHEHQK